LLLPIGSLPIVSLPIVSWEYGRERCRRYCVLAPLQKLTMSNSPQDGLSASKTHPSRPFRGRLGRRPRCEHGEAL